VFGAVLLDHYRESLREIRRAGYVSYARQQLAPYAQAAAAQFSPQRGTLTERLLDRL
jgi:hypothetical protein